MLLKVTWIKGCSELFLFSPGEEVGNVSVTSSSKSVEDFFIGGFLAVEALDVEAKPVFEKPGELLWGSEIKGFAVFFFVRLEVFRPDIFKRLLMGFDVLLALAKALGDEG